MLGSAATMRHSHSTKKREKTPLSSTLNLKLHTSQGLPFHFQEQFADVLGVLKFETVLRTVLNAKPVREPYQKVKNRRSAKHPRDKNRN